MPCVFWKSIFSGLVHPEQVGRSLLLDPFHRFPLVLSKVERVPGGFTVLLLLLHLRYCLLQLFGPQLYHLVVRMVVSRACDVAHPF